MKKFRMIFLGLLLVLVQTTAQAQDSAFKENPPVNSSLPQSPQQMALPSAIQWSASSKEATDKAKQENKAVILLFTGSDWCEWCKKMNKEVFEDPEFIRLTGNRFVFVELDFPMNKILPLDMAEQNAQLKYKYGITGYPTVVVLDSNGNFVAETGYRPGGGRAYAEYLLGLIQK